MSSVKRRTKMKGAAGVYRSSSGRYEIAYRDSTGKLIFQVVEGDFEEAKAARADVVARMGKGERVVGGRQMFAELAESWFESKSGRLRPRTSRYYRDGLDLVLLPRFGRSTLAAVDADAIAKLIRDLEREGLHAIDGKRRKRPLGHSAIVNYLKPAKGTLALAVRRGLIPANPFAVLTDDERPQRADAEQAHEWTDDDVAALLTASAELGCRRIAKHDYAPLLELVARIGLRLGEALGLRWEDFDKDEAVLHVRRQWLTTREYGPTKTPAGMRRIALPADLRDSLIQLRLRSRYSTDSAPMFASAIGTPLGHRNVTRRGFEPARDEAKLPTDLTFHDLRHAAASRLIAAGLSPVAVAAVLGHEDATTTLRVYAHLFDRQKTDDAVRVALTVSRPSRGSR